MTKKQASGENGETPENDIPAVESSAEGDVLDDFNADDLSSFDSLDDGLDVDEEPSSGLEEGASSDDPFADVSQEGVDHLDDTAPQSMGKKTSIVDLLKENWLYVLIGVIVISVAGYMIMGVLSPSGSSAAAAPQQQSGGNFHAPAPAQTATQMTAPGQPIAPPPVPTISMTQPQMDQLMQGFSGTVQSSMKNVQNEIETSGSVATNNNLERVQSQLGVLDSTITHLNKNLATANDRLNTTQAQLTTVLGQETADQQQLTLRAVVPGRAWLVNGKGQTISVTVGTSLGTIGIVTAIDADASTVTTSSGYIFK